MKIKDLLKKKRKESLSAKHIRECIMNISKNKNNKIVIILPTRKNHHYII